MNVHSSRTRDPRESLAACLRSRRSEFQLLAEADDDSGEFPKRALQLLAECGCLRAVLPQTYGGLGLGWRGESRQILFDVLRAVGGIHLSAARLLEGHINAFQLLWLYGTDEQRKAVCEYVGSGNLLGVWNAPSRRGELELRDDGPGQFRLSGHKAYASGAGSISRPLVTARHQRLGLVMVWPSIVYSVGPAAEWTMQGMRSSMTLSVKFDGRVSDDDIFGAADDYHRQPVFSGGAWRFLAAQLGAGERMVEEMRQLLLASKRTADPHQLVRMAACRVSLQGARLWIDAASAKNFDTLAESGEVVQCANEARVVVERHLLDVMENVQRSVGLQAFSRACPIERVARDLATYLRQPAPDALRESVGAWAFAHPSQGLGGALYDSEA